MKKLMLVLALPMLISTYAIANDKEKSDETTVDTSKNPITGTVTTTKKTKHRRKGAHGKSDVSVTETTKQKTDGSTEHSEKVNVDSSHKSE